MALLLYESTESSCLVLAGACVSRSEGSFDYEGNNV